MDILDISMAANKAIRSLEESGRVGYGKERKFRYDGKASDLIDFGGFLYAKISSGKVDLNDIVKATVTLPSGETMTVTKKQIVVYDNEWGQVATVGTGNPDYAIADDDGLYLLDMGEGYVSYIEFTETIHPIDPKFLPGVCLPVVELSTVIPVGGSNASLNEADWAVLNEAMKTEVPLVVTMTVTGITTEPTKLTAVFAHSAIGYTANLLNIGFILQPYVTDGVTKWVISFQQLGA